MLQTVGITITGKVQGVFFRKYTLEAAQKSGITGIVKNTSEGSVYIEATGTAQAISEFQQWCHKGSPWSKVENVSVVHLPLKHFTGFVIGY